MEDNFWNEKTIRDFADYYFTDRTNFYALHRGEAKPAPYQHLVNKFKEKVKNEQLKQESNNEVDYLITSFKHSGGDFYMRRNNGQYYLFSDGVHFDLEYLLREPHYKINSVQRKSDGIEFSVDERVIINGWNGSVYGEYVIESFEVIAGNLWIYCKDSLAKNLLKYITKKEKQPLFTTDDGVVCYEGDKVWLVSRGNWVVHDNPLDVCKNLFRGVDDHFKYFSTKEKANEYVTHNKPSLSINDFKDWVKNNWVYFHSQLQIDQVILSLTKLVEQKLKS